MTTISMTVDLKGLFENAVGCGKKEREYYNFCLQEVYDHLVSVVAGEATLEEFAELYNIPKKPLDISS